MGDYLDVVILLITRLGGRHASKPKSVEMLEGEDDGRRGAQLDFPVMQAIQAFWRSPEDVPVKELRQEPAVLEA